ncbi:hypothetical protein BGM09_28165 [Streptomyces sp. CBMA29]|nr:hypothetical protein [Streptomyces sp. CBMA29]
MVQLGRGAANDIRGDRAVRQVHDQAGTPFGPHGDDPHLERHVAADGRVHELRFQVNPDKPRGLSG